MIEDFSRAQAQNPMPLKVQDGHTVYLSHNDFGPLRSSFVLPKIADFGLAQYGKNELQRHPIQQDYYRAPEVILGAGWTYSADIWNLGVLVRFDFYMFYSPLTCFDKDLEFVGKERLIWTHLFQSRDLQWSGTHSRNDCAVGPSTKRTN